MSFLLPFPVSCSKYGALPLSRGTAHYRPSQGQHVAVTVNSNLFLPFVALWGESAQQCSVLLSAIITICHPAQTPLHWGAG